MRKSSIWLAEGFSGSSLNTNAGALLVPEVLVTLNPVSKQTKQNISSQYSSFVPVLGIWDNLLTTLNSGTLIFLYFRMIEKKEWQHFQRKGNQNSQIARGDTTH